MATVHLRYDHGKEIIDLPPVCIKCGAAASVRKNKQFSWQPQWVPVLILGGLLPYIIVSMVLTKRKTVETPLCNDHKSYWWMFPLVMWMLVLGLLGLGLVAMIAAAGAPLGHKNDSLPGLVCIGFFGGIIVVAIVGVIINNMRIRPSEITDRHIRLSGVSQEFADAVEEEEDRQRRAFDRDDDYERRPRRPREDEDPRYTR